MTRGDALKHKVTRLAGRTLALGSGAVLLAGCQFGGALVIRSAMAKPGCP